MRAYYYHYSCHEEREGGEIQEGKKKGQGMEDDAHLSCLDQGSEEGERATIREGGDVQRRDDERRGRLP